MDAKETKTFAHHDRVRDVAVGRYLLACEPFKALNNEAGGQVDIPVGATLRVRFNHGYSTITCDVALDGRVWDVGIFPRDFHCVEIKPKI